MIEFACPHCGNKMRVSDDAAGRKGTCNSCNEIVAVPGRRGEVVLKTGEIRQSRTSIRADRPDTNQPSVAVQVNVHQPSKASHSFGIAAVILGILAFLICWIPFFGLLGVPLSGLGLLLGVTGIVLSALRQGSGIGFPIAGSAICGLALLVAISISYVVGATVVAKGDALVKERDEARETNQQIVDARDKDAPSGKDNAPMPPPKDEWAEDTVQQGDIRVNVETAKVDFVELNSIGGDKGRSKDKLFSVKLRIENVSDSKKIHYRGWSGRDFDFGGTAASLHDDLDNSYKRVGFGFADKPTGQVDSESIYPEKSITDVLVFEEPVAKAKYLKLELPASAFGGTGQLRIKINLHKLSLPNAVQPKVETPKPVPIDPVAKAHAEKVAAVEDELRAKAAAARAAREKAAANEETLGRVASKWNILSDNGATIFVITLYASGDSRTTNALTAKGKWETLGNDIRITWGERDWKDIIRPVKGGYRKFAFKPGTSWNDKPNDVLRAVKE